MTNVKELRDAVEVLQNHGIDIAVIDAYDNPDFQEYFYKGTRQFVPEGEPVAIEMKGEGRKVAFQLLDNIIYADEQKPR